MSFDALQAWSGSQHTGPSSEELEMMGRNAVVNLVDHQVPLTESIAKEASATPGMTREHVRRACEYANQNAFSTMFKAASGEQFRVPHFEPADASQVSLDLEQGSPTPTMTQTDIDYATAPQRYQKVASSRMLKEAAAILGTEEATSTPDDDPMKEPFRLWQKLSGVHQKISARRRAAEIEVEGCLIDCTEKVSQCIREGNSIEEITHVLATLSSNPDHVKLASEIILSATHTTGVEKLAAATPETMRAIELLDVDRSSPLATSYLALTEKLAELVVCGTALNTITSQRDRLRGFLAQHV